MAHLQDALWGSGLMSCRTEDPAAAPSVGRPCRSRSTGVALDQQQEGCMLLSTCQSPVSHLQNTASAPISSTACIRRRMAGRLGLPSFMTRNCGGTGSSRHKSVILQLPQAECSPAARAAQLRRPVCRRRRLAILALIILHDRTSSASNSPEHESPTSQASARAPFISHCSIRQDCS